MSTAVLAWRDQILAWLSLKYWVEKTKSFIFSCEEALKKRQVCTSIVLTVAWDQSCSSAWHMSCVVGSCWRFVAHFGEESWDFASWEGVDLVESERGSAAVVSKPVLRLSAVSVCGFREEASFTSFLPEVIEDSSSAEVLDHKLNTDWFPHKMIVCSKNRGTYRFGHHGLLREASFQRALMKKGTDRSLILFSV